MTNETPQTIYLKDYQKPHFLISTVHLTFDLEDTRTFVTARMNMKRDGEGNDPLVLNGQNIELSRVVVNGKELAATQYVEKNEILTIADLPDEFELVIENYINPLENKSLEGLYKSGNIFCTQNEAEGFRRITYYQDRPDVMAKFTTKIIADKKLYPVLLSNGNPIGSGDINEERHWVEWEDPFPKPAYLYALVAGDLGLITDSYTTKSGRKVDLRIYCDKGNESRCHHAMESLKKSMKWDEDTYGLEYDLDIYMIVAVDSFNAGAMENKGLNIFNSVYVLADDKTATDDNFLRIESVIGHEYFHNWTGNRVTCRDWFQLTLKEGLTVFRDQCFSADVNSDVVQRITDVNILRNHQFEEDAGPNAHPIKPESYITIDNFYTATVYEKGAEVIRMIHTLLGKEGFRKGMDKYFELFDGQAVTTEDFVHAMSVANDFDFSDFMGWYSRSGTPRVKAQFAYDEKKETLSLTIEQCQEPLFFPMKIGILGDQEISKTLHVKKQKEVFTFDNIKSRPVVSLNRNFSAPIKLDAEYSLEDRTFLMSNDSDGFNRYEAATELANGFIDQLTKDVIADRPLSLNQSYINAFGSVLSDDSLDLQFKAQLLELPTLSMLVQEQNPIDYYSTYKAKEFVRQTLGRAHKGKLLELYNRLNIEKSYALDTVSMGERKLKNIVLSYLMELGEQEITDICLKQFVGSSNMTDEISSLALLVHNDCQEKADALNKFYQKWKHETLVMQKWLMVQASATKGDVLADVKRLLNDPVYDKTVPNLVRSLVGAYSTNYIQFHDKSGKGYKFLADQILEIDKFNSQLSSSLSGRFNQFARLKDENKLVMKTQLERILNEKGLSKNVFERVTKILA